MTFFCFWNLLVYTYYIPYYYENVLGRDPTKSGVALLPMMIAVVTMTTGGGFIITKTGHYWPWMVIAPM